MDAETLITKCRNNDQEAWTYVYNYLIAHLKKKNIARSIIKDIAQDTILYYLNRGIDDTQIKKKYAFKYLLRQKANGLAIDYINKIIRKKEDPIIVPKKNSDQVFENPKIKPYQTDTLNKLFYQQVMLILENALLKLDHECMEILTRYFKGKFSGDLSKDMADELGLKPNTFSTKVKRCNEKLSAVPEYQQLINDY